MRPEAAKATEQRLFDGEHIHFVFTVISAVSNWTARISSYGQTTKTRLDTNGLEMLCNCSLPAGELKRIK